MSLVVVHSPGGDFARYVDEERGESAEIHPSDRVLRRRPQPPDVSSVEDPAVRSFVLAQYRSAMNSLFAVPATWMNPAWADRRIDQDKLYGAALAQEVGFRTIPTVLTDSPENYRQWVRALSAGGRGVAVKAAGAWTALVEGSEDVVNLFTRRLTAEDALSLADAVRLAPVVLQPYIEKDHELRVTVVAGSVFACRIDSQQSEKTIVDWRHYDLENTPHSAVDLDAAVLAQLRGYMARAGLLYAAFDFIVTPSQDLVFVEVNPAGQFGWIEEITGLEISAAIADWLLVPSPA